MDLKKNINRYLTILLGIATILIYVLIGVLIFRKDLLFPKVQASPATCTVSDDVNITGSLTVSSNLGIGGRIDTDGNTMYGQLSCIPIKVECNGACSNAGSPNKICETFLSDYKPVSVSCADVRDDVPAEANWDCNGADAGSAACERDFFSYDLGYACDDTTGWDVIVTCCDSNY